MIDQCLGWLPAHERHPRAACLARKCTAPRPRPEPPRMMWLFGMGPEEREAFRAEYYAGTMPEAAAARCGS